MEGGPSGGTLETIVELVSHPITEKSKLGFNPLLKLVGSKEKSKNVFSSSLHVFLGYSPDHNSWVGFFPMSLGNLEIVRRSNAILNFGENLHYEEGMAYPNFFMGFLSTSGLFLLGTCFFNGPIFSFLRSYVLPKPGEGPSVETMENGFLNAVGYGTGSKGTKVKSELYFDADPGYKSTGRMLAEAGLTLAL